MLLYRCTIFPPNANRSPNSRSCTSVNHFPSCSPGPSCVVVVVVAVVESSPPTPTNAINSNATGPSYEKKNNINTSPHIWFNTPSARPPTPHPRFTTAPTSKHRQSIRCYQGNHQGILSKREFDDDDDHADDDDDGCSPMLFHLTLPPGHKRSHRY